MRYVADIGYFQDHSMTEILLDAETPVVDRGRTEVLRSRQHILWSKRRLRPRQVRDGTVEDERCQEVRRRRQRAGPSRHRADLVHVPGTAISDAYPGTQRGLA